MMGSQTWRWLLGIKDLPADEGNLRLAWEHPLPVWVWLGLFVLIVALAWWSYRSLEARRWQKWTLGSIRGVLLTLLLVLLAGPMLELPRVFTEPDWVVVLVDRSRSMSVNDDHDPEHNIRRTRADAIESILATANETWRTPDKTRRIVWLGFGENTTTLQPSNPTAPLPVDLGQAEGWRTDLAPALQEALHRTAGRPLAGIVLLSDGRTNAPPDQGLMRRLALAAAEVHVFPLGSRIPVGDTSIKTVDAPKRAFTQDAVPLHVQVVSRGQEGIRTVQLVDSETRAVLDVVEIEVSPDSSIREVTLTAPPGIAGSHTWVVEVVGGEDDLVPENNVATVSVELVDRPLRVLYIEGYPRWEYRYLKNLLVREPTIESSVMLLSADRDFAQEGNAPITRLPNTAEEFAAYDLIVIGDLPAGFLSSNQQRLIQDQVASRGSGLLFIGGERYLPMSWEDEPLAAVFPFKRPFNLDRLEDPATIEPTEAATRLGIFQLSLNGERGWPADLTNRDHDWPLLHWVQRIPNAQLKPTTEVLAEAVGVVPTERSPAVLAMRYGAGTILYVATDEVWRWRYGRGELIPEQFWIQLLRLLGREAAEDDVAVQLHVKPTPARVDQPVQIVVERIDVRVLTDPPERVRVDVLNSEGALLEELELVRSSETTWGGSWRPMVAQTVVVQVVDPAIRAVAGILQEQLDVRWPEQETRMADANHELLESIAEATSGAVYTKGTFDDLTLPKRSFTISQPLRERLWTSPLAFFILVLLGTLEWGGRRLARLD